MLAKRKSGDQSPPEIEMVELGKSRQTTRGAIMRSSLTREETEASVQQSLRALEQSTVWFKAEIAALRAELLALLATGTPISAAFQAAATDSPEHTTASAPGAGGTPDATVAPGP